MHVIDCIGGMEKSALFKASLQRTLAQQILTAKDYIFLISSFLSLNSFILISKYLREKQLF